MEVFHQQEREGIIELFKVVPENFTKHTWISHRLVFQTDEQTTTKIKLLGNIYICMRKQNQQ